MHTTSLYQRARAPYVRVYEYNHAGYIYTLAVFAAHSYRAGQSSSLDSARRSRCLFSEYLTELFWRISCLALDEIANQCDARHANTGRSTIVAMTPLSLIAHERVVCIEENTCGDTLYVQSLLKAETALACLR